MGYSKRLCGAHYLQCMERERHINIVINDGIWKNPWKIPLDYMMNACNLFRVVITCLLRGRISKLGSCTLYDSITKLL